MFLHRGFVIFGATATLPVGEDFECITKSSANSSQRSAISEYRTNYSPNTPSLYCSSLTADRPPHFVTPCLPLQHGLFQKATGLIENGTGTGSKDLPTTY